MAIPLGDGASCDDGDPCTEGDACASGSCVAGGPIDCSHLEDECNAGTCDPVAGCVTVPVSDGAACDDGDLCTSGELCSSGACIDGAPRDCSAFDDDCNAGECNPATGTCRAVPVADSTICDDGNPCTTIDRCTGGACFPGTPRDCSAMTDACNVGMCDPTTGGCYPEPVVDGTFCDDGDACTTSDECTAGVCGGFSTCCGIHDFRLSELYGDSPDYIEIVNTGTCSLSTSGLVLSWYLGCDTAVQTFTFPARTVAPGGVLRVLDVSTGLMTNEVYRGSNICHTYYEAGWIALCNGACSATCTNYLDYFEASGSTTLTARPSCATFTPAPLAMGSATYTQSSTRIAYTGSGATGRQSDWAVRTYSRTP
jgi:hypothetical protein